MLTTPVSRKRSQLVLGIVSLVVIFFVLAGIVWVLIQALTSISPEVAAAIVAGVASVLVSVGSLVYTKRWERRSVIEQEHRKQKAQTYAEFMTFFFKSMRAGQTAPLPPEELTAGFDAFTRELIIWGSSDILRKFVTFRNETLRSVELKEVARSDLAHAAEAAAQDAKSLLAFEDVLKAIRKDLGHEKSDLKPGELLATFVSDLDPDAFTPPV